MFSKLSAWYRSREDKRQKKTLFECFFAFGAFHRSVSVCIFCLQSVLDIVSYDIIRFQGVASYICIISYATLSAYISGLRALVLLPASLLTPAFQIPGCGVKHLHLVYTSTYSVYTRYIRTWYVHRAVYTAVYTGTAHSYIRG